MKKLNKLKAFFLGVKHGKWNLNIIVCERKIKLVIEKVGNVIGILKLKALFWKLNMESAIQLAVFLFLRIYPVSWKTCKRIDWGYFWYQNWGI